MAMKEVGFFVYNLRSYGCKEFKVLFHLWGNGGPQALREQEAWEKEQDDQWTPIEKKKSKNRSYADVVRDREVHHCRPSVTGANSVPLGCSSLARSVPPLFNRLISKATVFYRLRFPRSSVFDWLEFPPKKSRSLLNFEFGRNHRGKERPSFP